MDIYDKLTMIIVAVMLSTDNDSTGLYMYLHNRRYSCNSFSPDAIIDSLGKQMLTASTKACNLFD